MIWMTIIVVARWLVNWTCLSRATKNMQYVYIYVHMYTYVYVCLRMIMNLYICTRVYEGIHVHIYAHMHTYMRTCVYICTRSSADIWICAAFWIIKIRWACSRCVVACVWIAAVGAANPQTCNRRMRGGMYYSHEVRFITNMCNMYVLYLPRWKNAFVLLARCKTCSQCNACRAGVPANCYEINTAITEPQ